MTSLVNVVRQCKREIQGELVAGPEQVVRARVGQLKTDKNFKTCCPARTCSPARLEEKAVDN